MEVAEADGEVQEETDEEDDLDARGERVAKPVAEGDPVALGKSDLVARGEEVGDLDTLDDTVAGTSRLMVCAPLSATYSTCVVDS